ncbi:MAG: hypothetical protein JWM95_2565, partial [Gemmatimonadetes bacterium]|nr:hypothetical protein [Gemmatimonadota bacterium]
DTIGTVQIQATATGYTATSVNMQVTQPKFTLNVNPTLYTTSAPGYITVYATDANGNVHPVNADLTVTLLSSAPSVAGIDSTSVTIVANNYYSTAARWVPGTVGTAQLSASDDRAIRYPYGLATANVAVQVPPASLGIFNESLGLGQYIDTYVSIPNTPASAVTVPLGHAATPTTTTPASVVIPNTTSYVYFRLSGTTTGLDTITASPPNHVPAVGTVNVAPGIISPLNGWPSALAVGDSALITLYTRSPNGGAIRPVLAATTFALGSNANIVFVSGGSTITSAVVPADAYYVQFYVKGVTAGSGNTTITNANYVTYTNSLSVSSPP